MIEEIRQKLADLGLLLDLKEEQVSEMFDNEQLKAYFRSRDSIRLLIPSLWDLEVAMNENKVLL